MGEDLSFVRRYSIMIKASSLQSEPDLSVLARLPFRLPTTHDYVEFLAKQGWSLYDVLEGITKLCREEYQSTETQLCELLLVLIEREIYNKHWTGKEWVNVSESEPPKEKETTPL